MSIITKNTVEYLLNKKLKIFRVYTGSLMTSLDMKGFSITLMNINEEIFLEFLDQSVNVPYWPFSNIKCFNDNIYKNINIEQLNKIKYIKPNNII